MARTGRPREFDRDKAIDAATALFWAQGYEPTSLAQLKSCMGNISPASFYAAFGSKEALFREVVQRYLETYGQVMAPLWDESLSPRDAIERTLRGSARMQATRTHRPGVWLFVAPVTAHLKTNPSRRSSKGNDSARELASELAWNAPSPMAN